MRGRTTAVAWAMGGLSVALALGAVVLAGRNGESLPELVFNHHAIGIVSTIGLAGLGALIAVHQPRNPIGWLMSVGALFLGVFSFTQQYAPLAVAESLPGVDLASWLAAWTNLPGIAITITFVVLLFPDGQLPSPRWRPVVWLTAAATVVPTAVVAVRAWPARGPALAVESLEHPALGNAFGTGFFLVLVLSVVSLAALVVRFRRSTGTERQQIKWLAYGAMIGIPLGLPALVPFWGPILELIQPLLLFTGLGIGMFRYRLYDIDRLISRTVVYGLLSVGGVAVYVGVVKLAEWLVREAAGLGGSLVATAVIAVGFAPARDRLQRLVDRRLYGERHDPVRAVARLGQRLRDAPAAAAGGDVLGGVLAAVCETLRLPWARLLVEGGGELACVGRPTGARASIALAHEGQPIGALVVGVRSGEDALGVADRQVLQVLAGPVAVAVHGVLLSQELQRSRQQLVAAREEERRRLRRDLHDGLGPVLTAVTLKADAARSALDTAPDRADGLLAELRGDAKQAIADLRQVIEDLRPAPLEERGQPLELA